MATEIRASSDADTDSPASWDAFLNHRQLNNRIIDSGSVCEGINEMTIETLNDLFVHQLRGTYYLEEELVGPSTKWRK